MNAYILILTLIYGIGYGGMGGLESIRVESLEACERIGKEWDKKSSEKLGAKERTLTFVCVKL